MGNNSEINKSQPIHFQSIYNYGKKDEQLKVKNPFVSAINSLVVRLLKIGIFSGASCLKNRFSDPVRIEKARHELLSIGAQVVQMETPDGDHIDGMYLGVKNFRTSVEKYFDIREIELPGNKITQRLVIKNEYRENPSKEVTEFVQLLKNMGAHVSVGWPCSISLGVFPKESLQSIKRVDDNLTSQPTALIASGAGMSCAAHKGLAISYLLRGVNVMMVDFRGYGKSKGSPTEHRTKLDLETAYQYLHKEKGVKNEDLVIHGYCLGGGSASDLAARRKGVNLILDRSFAEFREVARERFPRIGKIIYKILPYIVNYNNAKNLGKIKGHIALVRAAKDNVISHKQITKQIDALSDTNSGQVVKLIHSEGGHTKNIGEELVTLAQFDSFLMQTGLYRRYH